MWEDGRVAHLAGNVSHYFGTGSQDLEAWIQELLVQLEVVKDCVMRWEGCKIVAPVLEPDVGRGNTGGESKRPMVTAAVNVLDCGQ